MINLVHTCGINLYVHGAETNGWVALCHLPHKGTRMHMQTPRERTNLRAHVPVRDRT